MADLTYSVQTLEQLAREMTALASDVVDEREVPELDVTLLARPEVVTALQTFEDDWAKQRRALATRLDAGGQLAGEAVTSFTETDRLLAEAALRETDQ
ncbi:MAG: hypothetical protein ABWX74_14590 [Aeromicrobium sp.]